MKIPKACTLLLAVVCGAKNGTFAIFLDQKALDMLVGAKLVSITGTRPGARRAKATASGRIVFKALLELGGESAAVRPRAAFMAPIDDCEPAPITMRYTH